MGEGELSGERQNVDKLGDLADLPPPVAQKVVDQLVALHELTPSRLYKLRLCKCRWVGIWVCQEKRVEQEDSLRRY